MIKLDEDAVVETNSSDSISSAFKLGGGIDINTIPGHYAKEDFELANSIIIYRDAINKLMASINADEVEDRAKDATAAMLDVTKAIEKLKVAKRLDGVKTLEPHEVAYLNIVAGLNQLFKSYIERIENHGGSESECECCSHKERDTSE